MKGGTRFTSGRREVEEEQYTRSIVADENRNPQRASSIVRAGVVIDGTEKGSRYVPFSLFFVCVFCQEAFFPTKQYIPHSDSNGNGRTRNGVKNKKKQKFYE